ncbi:MAG: anthranilate synthase component I [Phycisphaerales bacterium]|nr:anthranilate synthase component I [Phycisphaerales bacterium]
MRDDHFARKRGSPVDTLARVKPPVILFSRRLLSDQLTPVLAYRRLVAPDERTAASFLFESVEQGGAVGRYSMLGAQPALEVIARAQNVRIIERAADGSHSERSLTRDDPLSVARELQTWQGIDARGPVPDTFQGGWVGYVGFDAVRWFEPEKLPLSKAPRDDRSIADMHLALYRDVVVFDHATKELFLIVALLPGEVHPHGIDAAGERALNALESRLTDPSTTLAAGRIELNNAATPVTPPASSMSRESFEAAVRTAQEYIAAGDVFQVVLSQRFARESCTDPFDVYRALRIVSPSPYQVYLQASDCILIAASPEILCKTRAGEVINRPLAGTRRRGRTPAEDAALEVELLADEKERAEHTMLVDLGRNDLGRVCEAGSVKIERCMQIERFSHVMHISSTITGKLLPTADAWDALRATLPVGTVSGAPKVRAIQIIDELEPVRRGPYAGGLGAIGWGGEMDMAIALRTIVVPLAATTTSAGEKNWTYHLQTGAGVVLDSDPAAEFEETVNKAAALGRAIDLAEKAFVSRNRPQ